MSSQYHKRRSDILGRIGQAEGYSQCLVMDCTQTTMAKSGAGLNRNYCRRHVEHFRRHGSYSKPSYTTAELNPFRRNASAWLQAHPNRPEVIHAVERVRDLYWRGGRPEVAFRLAGKTPDERARYVWARLRESRVDPLVVLAAAVAVKHCIDADPQREWRREYLEVQIGKLLHRMAGGSHKRWEHEWDNGTISVTELHKYPASRGRVLRHLGGALVEAASGLVKVIPAVNPELAVDSGSRPPRVKARANR